MKGDKEVLEIVNRNHRCRRTMKKIDNDLRYVRFAKRLSAISARRKK